MMMEEGERLSGFPPYLSRTQVVSPQHETNHVYASLYMLTTRNVYHVDRTL